jgi:SEL1 protein
MFIPGELLKVELTLLETAAKAYKLALQTLSTFPPQAHASSQGFLDAQPSPLLESLFPNQQGPIATLIRIILKLRQQSWMPEFVRVALGRDTWNAGKKREEMMSRAVKVVDLLEHAIELGHVESIYKLAQLSLVRKTPFSLFGILSSRDQFPPNPLLSNVTRALNMYHEHARLTGNATSQSMLAFFYGTGYKDVVPVDQAKALLYYTFAAHSGDKGAQMALGYRYWAGIGVNDDCKDALDWYQSAAEQCKIMAASDVHNTLIIFI